MLVEIEPISLNKGNPDPELMIFDREIPSAISDKGHIPPAQTYNNAVLVWDVNADVAKLAVLSHPADLLSQNHKTIFLGVLDLHVRHFDKKWHVYMRVTNYYKVLDIT